MSCLSRLFGLVCALVPGLGLLILSVALASRWPELGAKGPLYSFFCAVTGAVCLFLGATLLFGRNRTEPKMAPLAAPLARPVAPVVTEKSAPNATARPRDASANTSIFAEAADASPRAETLRAEALDSPEVRIAQLARARPGWRGNAPQLAQLTNLSLGVAEATARSMAQNGAGVQMVSGDAGETIFVLNPEAF